MHGSNVCSQAAGFFYHSTALQNRRCHPCRFCEAFPRFVLVNNFHLIQSSIGRPSRTWCCWNFSMAPFRILVVLAMWATLLPIVHLDATSPRRMLSARAVINPGSGSDGGLNLTGSFDHVKQATDHPLIGILSQPIFTQREIPGGHNQSFISASYVKLIEAAGARPVPISFDAPRDEIKRIMRQINGVIFPGGSSSLDPDSQFFETATYIWELAVQFNRQGVYFPILGVCLGFEAFLRIVSDDVDILEDFVAGVPSTLEFTGDVLNSRIFGSMGVQLLRKLEKQQLAMEAHRKGISPAKFHADKNLTTFFRVLSYSHDENGKKYVSTMEAKHFPFSATQWHPEKNAFEWIWSTTPHSRDAVEITQGVANFIADESRKCPHKPDTLQSEMDLLIYNYPPWFSEKADRAIGSVQLYLFPLRSPGNQSVSSHAHVRLRTMQLIN
eukprot:jgi/Mesvir1/21758/Mv04163-RA.1